MNTYRHYRSWHGFGVGSPSVWAKCDPYPSSDVAHAGLVLLSPPADQCSWSPVAGACIETERPRQRGCWRAGAYVEPEPWHMDPSCDPSTETKC